MCGHHAYAAHVGDSRVYRVRDDSVLQITEDHTLINYKLKHGMISAEDAEKSSAKNVITRAVGHKDYVQVDTFAEAAELDDRYLLCSDGLHGYFRDNLEVATLLSMEPMEAGARRAIQLANERGGRDNITALLVRVTD